MLSAMIFGGSFWRRTPRFVMTFLTSFARTLHVFLNLSGQTAPQNVPPPEINVSLLRKNLSCLKLMTVAFGKKMPIGCPMRRENLGVVRHFPAVPLCTAGHNDLLRPPLWYTCQKIQIDDTVITKTKPSSKAKCPTEGTGWHYSHLEGKIVYGYQVHAVIASIVHVK